VFLFGKQLGSLGFGVGVGEVGDLAVTQITEDGQEAVMEWGVLHEDRTLWRQVCGVARREANRPSIRGATPTIGWIVNEGGKMSRAARFCLTDALFEKRTG
jgi:hypothetical protein